MKDFGNGLAISQLIPKNKFDELVQKWELDKGITKLVAERLVEILFFNSVFEKRTLRDAEDSYSVSVQLQCSEYNYGFPMATLDGSLKKHSCGFFQEPYSLAIKELIGVT